MVASSIFFDILQQIGFSEIPKSPPFTILKTLRFSSLGYSADFRRSRLVIFCSLLHVISKCEYGSHICFSETFLTFCIPLGIARVIALKIKRK